MGNYRFHVHSDHVSAEIILIRVDKAYKMQRLDDSATLTEVGFLIIGLELDRLLNRLPYSKCNRLNNKNRNK